ncbi:uncharacterized protein LOC111906758 isoform X1 [Lactuca sativa]|uniref:uncharacterized protein LOC111906758 isoform X1 n=1 Tax=Lactuca sativa TaxID=4236 RepID=UPI000CD996A0|nr:uncharacterized protein LOC111906758 isoform X1 [Lactuca sativa]
MMLPAEDDLTDYSAQTKEEERKKERFSRWWKWNFKRLHGGAPPVAPSNLRGLFSALVLPQSSSLSDSESITLKSELQKQHQKTKLIKKNSYAGSNFKFMFPT